MRKNNLKDSGGFTLVEILVVLTIILMLSGLAVNGYLTYRKTALLDLAADDLVAQINEMRAKTIYSDDNGVKLEKIRAELNGGPVAEAAVAVAKCYGLEIGNVIKFSTFSEDFINKKVWDNVKQSWEYKGCDGVNFVTEEKFLVGDGQVRIFELQDQGGVVFSQAIFKFLPPRGDLEFFKAENEDPEILEEDDYVDIKIQYGEEEDLRYQKRVRFHLLGKTAEILNTDEIL